MAITMLEPLPAPPAVEPGLGSLLAGVQEGLSVAAGVPMQSLDDAGLGEAVSLLARIESRAAALRWEVSAEADRRRVAEQTGETGTDAWLARLTVSTREQAAGGLWLAGLLQTRYAATREAFAAGRVRVEQVRVIVTAAEQAPAEATPVQVRVAEEWLVAKATGAGTRTGRPMDAKRLRQAARRMFACVDVELASPSIFLCK